MTSLVRPSCTAFDERCGAAIGWALGSEPSIFVDTVAVVIAAFSSPSYSRANSTTRPRSLPQVSVSSRHFAATYHTTSTVHHALRHGLRLLSPILESRRP
jgi:hypothetical protein